MVMVRHGEKEFCMDGYLVANLEHMKHDVLKKDYDGFVIVSGKERFGKSTLASQMACFLDPNYNLDKCCFTAEQFVQAVEKASKGDCIVFDETMGYLSSRSAMSKFNRSLIKVFSEMGSKNLFIILCIPNFFELDRYPAIHRSNALFHVYKRGAFMCFNYDQKRNLYTMGKKYYAINTKPSFVGSFVKYFSLAKDEYEKKKLDSVKMWVKTTNKENKLKEQRDKLIKIAIENKLLTPADAAELINLSKAQIYEIIQVSKAL